MITIIKMINYFEQETSKSLRYYKDKHKLKFMWFRIPDTNMTQRINSNIISVKTPADYMAVYNGIPYFIECKSSKSKTSYAWRYIRDHQIEYSKAMIKAGGYGWFLLNRRYRRGLKCYALSGFQVAKLKESCLSSKWDFIKSIGLPLKRLKDGMWDLSPLFESHIINNVKYLRIK